MEDNIPVGTSKLADNEQETAANRIERIGRVTKEVEVIFLREDLTMGDLAEVMDLFNARAHSVFSRTKIKEVKESYERN